MSFGFRDYYQQLGVPRTASQSEIRAAFRRLARQYHPDVATDKGAAEEKFKEINEAYEVLGNPESRRKYDAYRSRTWFQEEPSAASGFASSTNGTAQAPPPSPNPQPSQNASNPKPPPQQPESDVSAADDYEVGGTGFSDFFERLFGARRAAATRAARRGPASGLARGQDIEADFLVKLEEVLHGGARRITFRRNKTSPPETCIVKIPRGVTEGQRIRLAGLGEKGRSGQAGDLYLRVKLQQHPDFQVEGHDLITEVELPAYRMALGTEIEVPTLEGRARVRVPPGSQAGQMLRLAGLGLPDSSGKRGHLFVSLVAQNSRHISPEEQRLWEAIARMKNNNQPKK